MEPLVDRPVAFVAVKAGSTAAAIWLTERVWKRNRVAAVAMMVGMNVALGGVVGHNAAVARLN